MFASMLYKAFKGGETMFHLFTDHVQQDPTSYEQLAVELIKFAGELRAAMQKQQEAVAPVASAEQAQAEPTPEAVVEAPAQP